MVNPCDGPFDDPCDGQSTPVVHSFDEALGQFLNLHKIFSKNSRFYF